VFLSLAREISAKQVRNRNVRLSYLFMNGASRVLLRSAVGIITFERAVGIQRRYKSKRVRDTSAVDFLTCRSVDLIIRGYLPRAKKKILSSCNE